MVQGDGTLGVEPLTERSCAIDPGLEAKLLKIHSAAAVGVGLPPAQRKAFVRDTPECQEREFAELLLGVAVDSRFDAPEDTVRCAHLAAIGAEVGIANGSSTSRETRALAWAELGNGHRIQGDLPSASEAFGAAWQESCRLSRRTIGTLASLQASYFNYLLDPVASLRLLSHAESIFEGLGDRPAVAKLQIKKALLANRLGRPREAIGLLEAVLRGGATDEFPKLRLAAVHNLADALILANSPSMGIDLLKQHEEFYAQHGDPRVRIRGLWVLGLGTYKSGRKSLGEAQLIAASHRLRKFGYKYELACLLLDHCRLLEVDRRWTEVPRLAEEGLYLARLLGLAEEARQAEGLLLRAK